MIEITVNVKGLDGLVAALQGLGATAVQTTPAQQAVQQLTQQPILQQEPIQQTVSQPIQAPPVQQTAPPQTYQAPQQMAPPVTVPVDQPVQQPIQQPIQAPPVGVPTSDVNYTNEQLAVAMTSLVDAGKMDAVRALLNRFNAPSLMQLPKEMYGAFANELRQMGAKL